MYVEAGHGLGESFTVPNPFVKWDNSIYPLRLYTCNLCILGEHRALCLSLLGDQMTICDYFFLLFLIFLLFWRVGCHRQCPSCCFQPFIDVGLIFSKAQSHLPHCWGSDQTPQSGTVLPFSSTALGASTHFTTADWNPLLPRPMVLPSSFHREKVQHHSGLGPQ